MTSWQKIKYALVAGGVLILALSAFGAITNFSQVQSDSPYKVGSYNIVKTAVFPIDSLTEEGNYAIWTLYRGISILRMDVTTLVADSVGNDTVNVIVRCGSDSAYVQLGSDMSATGAYKGSSTTQLDLSAAAVCTVQTQNANHSQGTDSQGGQDAVLVVQYTDY